MMREYFVNADFDLSLRRGRPPRANDARVHQARELPIHMLFLGLEGDSILVPALPEEDFLHSLGRLDVPVPTVEVLPSITPRARFAPFGWNSEAERLNRRYEAPSPHPPLDVVRTVNGRTFAAEIERRNWSGRHVVGFVRSADELEVLLGGRSPDEEGWLVKSEHGNGGFGNRRLRTRVLGAADRKTVDNLLAEDEKAVLERWLPRVTDLATVFEVDEAGEPREALSYEVVNTADGALIGDVFDASSSIVDRWGPELQSMTGIVARELAAAGYAGPVCVDSFVWDEHGVQRLRPVVDINARLFMAAGVERLWRMWDRDRVVYWRLFSFRKLRLPADFGGLERALGGDAFDPRTRCGVLVTSPMTVEGRRPRRLGVLLSGVDRRSVDTLDLRFRERFER